MYFFLIDYENKLMADSMHLFVSNGLCHITFTMAPAASAFHLPSFTTSHIDIAVIISTITMFTSHIFLMIIVNGLRSDINTIICYNSRHRSARGGLHPFGGGSCLLSIIVEYLLLHHGILHTHCIYPLLHLPAPRRTSWAIVEQIVALRFCRRKAYEYHRTSNE